MEVFSCETSVEYLLLVARSGSRGSPHRISSMRKMVEGETTSRCGDGSMQVVGIPSTFLVLVPSISFSHCIARPAVRMDSSGGIRY
jgi:hypothetical protein